MTSNPSCSNHCRFSDSLSGPDSEVNNIDRTTCDVERSCRVHRTRIPQLTFKSISLASGPFGSVAKLTRLAFLFLGPLASYSVVVARLEIPPRFSNRLFFCRAVPGQGFGQLSVHSGKSDALERSFSWRHRNGSF